MRGLNNYATALHSFGLALNNFELGLNSFGLALNGFGLEPHNLQQEESNFVLVVHIVEPVLKMIEFQVIKGNVHIPDFYKGHENQENF